ncbi:MAG: CHAT domain-containing protein [Polaromonas sp.]|nr:CHAT domain-containing protein [Polaromonas sp.]
MKNRHLPHGLVTVLLSVLLLGAVNVQAQLAEEPVTSLSEPETLRLRQILDTPMDSTALKVTKIAQFREKDLAAFKLGDIVSRESNARAWALVDPGDGKWSLMSILAGTEKRAESYQLGKELINENKWPPSAVRLRTQIALNYVDDNNMKEAGRLIDEAEKIIRYEFSQIKRRSDTEYWTTRAEMQFLVTKSRHQIRSGRWGDGIQSAKLAVSKGKDILRLSSTVSEASWRTYGELNVLFAMLELSSRQLAAGLYSDAEWTLRDTFKLAKVQGFNENQMVGFYNRSADLYNATGQFKEAFLFAQRSENILLSQGFLKGSPNWLFSQFRANVALAGQDEWPQALASLEQMDEQLKRLKTPPALANRASVRAYIYLKNGRQVDALRVLRGSLKWHVDNFGENHYLTASLRGMFAVALWQNNLSIDARVAFDQAMQNFTSPDSLTGDFVESSFQKKIRHYILQSYMELLAKTAAIQPKDAEILFQVADQLNASSVQQALSDAAVRAGVTVPGLSEIIRKEQDAKNEIASLTGYITGQGGEADKRRNPLVLDQMRTRIREVELARKGYKDQIRKSYPDYFQLIQPKSPSPSDIAQQLKPDELFVSILPMEDKTYLWAIDSTGRINFHIADMGEKQAHSAVEKIRKTLDVAHLGERAPTFDYAGSFQLYQQLLSPFETALVGKKHLVVATSGALSNLPLAVLTRTAYSGRNAALAPWLVNEVAVSHVPTANGWLSLKKLGSTPSSQQALMAWGDPAFDPKLPAHVARLEPTLLSASVRSVATLRSADLMPRNVLDPETYVNYSKLPALPETRDEVLELAKILSANPEQDVILGTLATRASVLKSSALGQLARKQVIVFATHGLLAGDLPNLNQPALAMAATHSPTDSPLLTLEDVLTLKLNADWVVLSACNTAGADGRAGEALTGLARGFFYAGSRSLLVTHWAVETESAMMLTTKTFAAYKGDAGIRRAEALRQAMLETMKVSRFSHPAYWAPYALVGEGGR